MPAKVEVSHGGEESRPLTLLERQANSLRLIKTGQAAASRTPYNFRGEPFSVGNDTYKIRYSGPSVVREKRERVVFPESLYGTRESPGGITEEFMISRKTERDTFVCTILYTKREGAQGIVDENTTTAVAKIETIFRELNDAVDK